MDGRAEADPVKRLLLFEINQQRTNKVCDVVIERDGCKLARRSRVRCRQIGIQ